MYRVNVPKPVRQEVDRLPGKVRQVVRRAILDLATNPQPPKSKELRGIPGRYRIPIEKWRVIYDIDEERQIIDVRAVKRKTGPEIYQDEL
jgi:mRNA interferase RelE/StbE